jgi:hypothetical protein
MRARPTAALVVLGAAILIIVTSIRVVLRVPGIPYNVRELFLDHASTPALVYFAVTLLWIGGGAVTTAHLVARSQRPHVIAPAALLLTCIVGKVLLSRAITYESIDDIIGSNALYGMVTRGEAWGARWSHSFAGIGENTIDFLERRVRFTALYSIPLIGIASMFSVVDPMLRARLVRRPRPLMVLILFVALWLFLARTIVVPWAGTDNLTELLATRPPLGIGGEWFLFAIALLIGLSAAMLVRGTERLSLMPVAVVVTIAAIPAGWQLLNLGLEQHVEKYGAVFSGAQFLLGPDRTHSLSRSMLFIRWTALQLGMVLVTFTGAWIVHRLIEPTLPRQSAPDLRALAR